MKYFDFSEALSCLNCGMTVGIEIDGKTRFYFMDNDIIICKVNNMTYQVRCFYIDAIMSNKWFLVDNEVN